MKENKLELSPRLKIAIINTLQHKIYDYSICGDECEYIAVKLDDEVIEALKVLGKTDEQIEEMAEGEDNIDLGQVGFEFANWWSRSNGFTL